MVDFQLSEEQQMIRDTIGAFACDEIRPAARLADENAKIPPELTEKIWQLGLVRGAIPETYGGGPPGSVRAGDHFAGGIHHHNAGCV